MNKINVGDVYFLKSPIRSSVSKEHAKRISYLLGTVPARPVVIFRPPAIWDTYGEVTIIPAIHNENEPGVKVESYDRFGRLTDSTYNFTVHAMHTVPVTRLGNYIGRLTDSEMERVRKCVNWLNSGMPLNDVPDDYKTIFNIIKDRKINPPHFANTDDIVLDVDGNMNVCETNLSKNKDSSVCLGELDIDIDCAISPEIAEQIRSDDNFKIKSEKTSDKSMEFPPSAFSYDDLCRYASSYTYDKSLINKPKPSVDILTKDDISEILDGSAPYLIDDVFQWYDKMTPTDVFVLGVWLPRPSLVKMTNLSSSQVVILKRLCNKMSTLSNDDIKKHSINDKVEVKESMKREVQLKDTDINDILEKLKPYLSEARIMCIPENLYDGFMNIPKYMIRRSYRGRKFEVLYKKAVSKIKADARMKGV